MSDVKPFCPCDVDRPQDCSPEDWPGAHDPTECADCGRPFYAHALREKLSTPEGDVWIPKCGPPQERPKP